MTDAERRVAGKTYRVTKGLTAGSVVTFDDNGVAIKGTADFSASEILYLMADDPYAEEVLPPQRTEATPEPEVKVGDRFEWFGRAFEIVQVDAQVWWQVIRLHRATQLAGSVEWFIDRLRDGTGRLRRLPPEPAKPLCDLAEQGSPSRKELCECGAEAVDGWFSAIGCNCQIHQCAGCWSIRWDDGQELRHRALKHSEVKKTCECGAEAGYQRDMGACGCMVNICKACQIDRRGSMVRHRALKHPEPKKERCECGADFSPKESWKVVYEGCRCEVSVCENCFGSDFDTIQTRHYGLHHPERVKRKPDCACLSMACESCGPKLTSDGISRECMDDIDARKASRAPKALPRNFQWSQNAMMGGFWGVHGRK